MSKVPSRQSIYTSAKNSLICCSTFFLLEGAVLLAVGVYGKIQEDKVKAQIIEEIAWAQTGSTVLIILGAIVIAASSLGCCCIASGQLIKMFGVIFTIAFLTEVGAGIFLITIKNEPEIETAVYYAVRNLYVNNPERMGNIELELGCCGANGPEDYKEPPDTCYPYKDTMHEVFIKGCAETIQDEFAFIMRLSNIVPLVLAAGQVLTASIAFCCCTWCMEDKFDSFFGGIYYLHYE